MTLVLQRWARLAAGASTAGTNCRAMASAPDRMSAAYAAVPTVLTPPWDATGRYRCDLALLEHILSAQKAKDGVEPSWAVAMDVWVATELRRAEFEPDAVWPRALPPRTLPQGVS